MDWGKLRNRGKSRTFIESALVIFCIICLASGCTRRFYRNQADLEVYSILAEKDQNPEWKIEQFHVYPDPRARFADPSNPDRPPMPPDDPDAWKLSPHPQHPPHRAGIGTWLNDTYLGILSAWDEQNREARRAALEAGPEAAPKIWRDLAGNAVLSIQNVIDGTSTEQGGFWLRLDQAVELGLINSREYQSVREDLYLTALPVTEQRFNFAWQWAATETAIRQWAGPLSSVGPQNDWNLGSSVSVRKLFSTGALLTAAFANESVFNFRRPGNGFTSSSVINLDFVQPLLQGGGKAVTLEPLTQTERNLVYGVRAYARFREQFYTSIAIGGSVSGTLAAAVGAADSSVLAAIGLASTDVASTFRGYLPLLFRDVSMAVDLKYVKDLERALKLFEGFQEGGQVAPLQVQQVQSQLDQARNSVLRDAQNRANALDQLNLQLGLPTNTKLLLDDAQARPITRVLDGFYEVLSQADAAGQFLDKQQDAEAEKLRKVLLKEFESNPLFKGTSFPKKAGPTLQAWTKLKEKERSARVEELAAKRRKLLDLKTDLELVGKKLSPEQIAELVETEFDSDMGLLDQVLRRYESKPWEKAKNQEAAREERNKLFRTVVYTAQLVFVYARNERFDLLSELWPALPRAPIEGVDLLALDLATAQEVSVQIALTNRWDLMNARARVVDAWRQLAVTANALLGVLNVKYHLDTQTPPGGTRPLAFSAAATNQEMIINAQLPLVRIVERNNYRTALINYERARRNLMALEDNVAAQVRSDVRQLQLFAETYKIQQKLVESLYSQVENSLEVLVAPVDPTQLSQSGTAGQANAAALTNQYLSALQGLRGAQSQMYDVWLSFLATRVQVYFDLERLLLNSRGVWIDETGNSTDGPCPPSGRPILGAPQDEWGAPAGQSNSGAGRVSLAPPQPPQ